MVCESRRFLAEIDGKDFTVLLAQSSQTRVILKRGDWELLFGSCCVNIGQVGVILQAFKVDIHLHDTGTA